MKEVLEVESSPKVRQKTVIRYTREQLLSSGRYRSQKDLLSALLKEKEMYSLEETEERISQFMKGKVKELC